MKVELNKFIHHLACSYFQIRGVYRYKVSSGSSGQEKAAPYPGFIFPISGCSEYHFANTPYLISTGTVLHGSGGGVIQKRVVGKQDWEFIVLLYEPKIEPEDMVLAKTHFSFPAVQTSQTLDLLYQLHWTANLPSGFATFQVETLARRVLEETFLSAKNQTQQGANELFETVSTYIQTHYMDPLSVNGLAAQNGVNENRLFYIFQKHTGMGPSEYLQNYRLNRAKELIITSMLPINQISLQVGYTDPLYFSRAFKKQFGVSPSKMR